MRLQEVFEDKDKVIISYKGLDSLVIYFPDYIREYERDLLTRIAKDCCERIVMKMDK